MHLSSFPRPALDITERKRIERALKSNERKLLVKTKALQEMNAALHVLLNQRDEDKKELEEKLLYNIKTLVAPQVKKLQRIAKTDDQLTCLEILEANLKNVISPFLKNITMKHSDLTPKEIQVANLIKDDALVKSHAAVLS